MEFLDYKSSHIEEIQQLFCKVFTDSEGQAKGELIGNLANEIMTETDDKDLYGFIATESEQVIGSIFFTRLIFQNRINAFLLSPVAIHTRYQGKGIGQKLINFGLNRLKEKGVELVFTYGDLNFYAKVGFKHITEKVVKAPLKLTYPEGWLGQSFTDDEIKPITGNSYCVETFNKPEIW